MKRERSILQLASNSLLRVRPRDDGPATNIDRRDEIGVGRMIARSANKLGLAFAVALVAISALGARPARVLWVNEHDGQPLELSFVFNEKAQLEKRPRVQLSSSRLASRYPSADAAQVFQRDSAAGAFSRLDNLLGNAVVDVASEARFLAAALNQQTLGRLGSFLLKSAAEAAVSPAQTVEALATVQFAIGIGGYVDDAEVNAEKLLGFLLWGTLGFTGNVQIEFAVAKSEFGFSALTVEQRALNFVHDEWNVHAFADGPNGDSIVFPRQAARVVSDGSEWAEGMLLTLVQFVATGDFGDGEACNIGFEREFLASGMISQFVQREAPKFTGCKGFGTDAIACRVDRGNGSTESFRLKWIGPQFDVNRELHVRYANRTVRVL